MCWEMKLVLMLRWMRTRELLFWTTSLPSYCFISLDTYKRVPITQKGLFIANILECLHFLAVLLQRAAILDPKNWN